ncbi:MAG: bifunctional phosphopantothenoylcysteine decarboxylase/phosphopantothenate--cysteine ligase CoaBC [Gammaproteobacteria bacterium]|nr:bifunctional phosphopantothenoylcysteine decarboxylase/phosphopantothenate--cysteine ligase CoaBC [Gammaproteobacteria bacterium]
MNELTQKKVLLGITGGIAAYKTAELVRLLVKAGAQVKVVMTQGAQQFVTATTFQALSGYPVYHDHYQSPDDGMEHISLARWADVLLIAPASTDFIAKMAHGLANDLLSTLYMATRGIPVAVAPAMNNAMWAHPANQNNITLLRAQGVHIFGPGSGDQACGETGEGRMLEAEDLANATAALFSPKILQGKTVMITAGPTREAIDPVRYLSNHSSGKMGYALARAAHDMGANVVLVSGPVSPIVLPKEIQTYRVTSAQEMFDTVRSHISRVNIFIGAAAVADYRPKTVADDKIKKHDASLEIELVRNPDILAHIAAMKPRPFCVGFAAETENLDTNAQEKLVRKDLDMIAANWVGDKAAQNNTGFDSDENALHVYTRENDTLLRKSSKQRLARQLLELIAERYHETDTA